MFIVGNKLDRSLACGLAAGIRTVYLQNEPRHDHSNAKALSHGFHPDFTILDLRQIPYILEVMRADVQFIEQMQSGGVQGYQYRQHMKELPSSKRIRVGLLIDGDGQL